MPQDASASAGGWAEPAPTALLVLADGTVLEGFGIGAEGEAPGEVCFNTAMTGYQEILTDPSYAGQIVTFTFPHIGNVGTNEEDLEGFNPAASAGARGVVLAAAVTEPSNWRATRGLDSWLKARGIVGITGIDTRALTAVIRERGMPNAILAHDPAGAFDRAGLSVRAAALPAMEGLDLVPPVTSLQRGDRDETTWDLAAGYGRREGAPRARVVAIDYGIKRNILRLLADAGCEVTVMPATASAAEVMALEPDGVFLSNGPGDPAATGAYAVPVIRELLERRVPTFGICLGHQLLGLAVGGRTVKMPQGHHGANHPVKDETTGKVEIVSMNHGFAIDPASLPGTAVQTHVSLFDGSNCGLRLTDRPAFSVQHHPEASPGPRDSHYLFDRFVALMAERDAPANGTRRPDATRLPLNVAEGSKKGRSSGRPRGPLTNRSRRRGNLAPQNRRGWVLYFSDDSADDFSRLHRVFVFHLGVAVALAWMTALYAACYAPWVRNIRALLEPIGGPVESTPTFLFGMPAVMTVAWLVAYFGRDVMRKTRLIPNQLIEFGFAAVVALVLFYLSVDRAVAAILLGGI